MIGNTFGNKFRVTTFGESHGVALGCVIDGCPSGIKITQEVIQSALDRRKPGATFGNENKTNPAVTERKEQDQVEILSGIFEDKTTGTPITLIIKNTAQNPQDYEKIKNTYRPGHADFTYELKYNGNQDYRGGGRSSGRETCARVAAGAIANEILKQKGIKITAYTTRAAGINVQKYDLSQIEENPLRACDNEAAKKMEKEISRLRSEGDSAGGIIECVIDGVPCGVGSPVFDKLDAQLAKAMLSIGSVKGIEFGEGFAVADLYGSQNNDSMHIENGDVIYDSNHCGGILGGLSNGNKIVFRIAVKPVPSIFKSQQTVCKINGKYENTTLELQGRHDVCLCPRIVPVVEAMAALVLVDLLDD